MGVSRTLPNIVMRMQQHAQTFDFALQHNDFATAKLKALQMNMDLEPEYRVLIGHGIDKSSLPKKDKLTEDDLDKAELLDNDCPQCKNSISIYDVHPPPDLITASEKTNAFATEMEWLTNLIILIEKQISFVGYKKGWWNE